MTNQQIRDMFDQDLDALTTSLNYWLRDMTLDQLVSITGKSRKELQTILMGE
jgi:hypothetical protein